jgi:hypothetical protein
MVLGRNGMEMFYCELKIVDVKYIKAKQRVKSLLLNKAVTSNLVTVRNHDDHV